MELPHSCLICQGRAKDTRVQLGAFRVYQCRRCHFRWIGRDDLDTSGCDPSFRDYPHNALLRRHFEAMKHRYLRGLQQRVARSLGGTQLADRSFLDVGCANGEYLWAAKTLGFGKVVGAEVDEVAAEQARAYGQVETDLSALPESSFDLVQVKNVLANVREFRAMLMRSSALVKPAGVLFIDVPNEDSLSAGWRRWLLAGRLAAPSRYGYLCPPHVVNGFGQKSFQLLLTQCGLSIMRLRTVWIGHPLAPYRSGWMNPMTPLTRLLTSKGALLISECRRPAVPA